MRCFLLPASAALALAFACATTPPPSENVVAEVQEEDPKLSTGDVIEIRVYREPDLAGVYRVSSQGDIDFPLIRKVRILGLDTDQIADEIRARLADGYIRDPQVQVFVREVQRDHDATIFLTTHDMAEAEALCDRIAFLVGGRVVALGTPLELRSMVAGAEGRSVEEIDMEDVFMELTGRSVEDDEEEVTIDG